MQNNNIARVACVQTSPISCTLHAVELLALSCISQKRLDKILFKPHHTISMMYILVSATFIEIDSLQHLDMTGFAHQKNYAN